MLGVILTVHKSIEAGERGCWGAGVLGCGGARERGCGGAGVLGSGGAGVRGCGGEKRQTNSLLLTPDP
jgi:hypothetical protein